MENPAGYSCVRRFCVQQLSKNTGRKISLRLVIVTGMSGAGKTTALKTLEDMGFYCADNLPVLLIEKFAELVMNGQSEKQDIALGVDVRSGEELPYLETIIRKWRENKYPFSILFLDSSDEVLIKRFKETRRSHPLSRTGRVEKGIELEREKLAFLKKEADQVIDTSRLLTKELRHELENLYRGNDGHSSMFITVLSFGFKYGIPADADLVFDVRFLPNPYYVEELRFHTGTEKAVQDYVMQGGTGEEFLKKLNDLLEFVIPKYEQEGKTQLVIAIGCTGGRHRSVTIAGEVFKRLTESGRYEIRLEHRDAGKDGGSLCGRIQISGDDHYSIKIHTENVTVARKCFTLLRKTFNIETDISIRRNAHLGKNRIYSVCVKQHEDALRVLKATKLLSEDGEIGENLSVVGNVVVQNPCCRRAFLRGAFLASGSISDPEKFYHFEIVCATDAKARQIQSIMATFDIDAKIVIRKRYYVVYIKEGSQIVDILNVMEAHLSLMELENIRILKEMRGNVNRQVNCETANINKTVSAAVKQIEDIEFIRDTVGFESLPDGLAQIARARLLKPEATLKELGEDLEPPVGKSGVNHRLRKLGEMAEKLRDQGTDS